MRHPEDKLTAILKGTGVDFTSSLPCEKIKALLYKVSDEFFHVPLTREEEGVGISAGAALSGKRPAMFVQSSGIGNMINALLSLTGFYELPLAIFVSRRGIYKERIKAQIPMGKKLPGILRGAGIPFSIIDSEDDIAGIERRLTDIYEKNKIHAFLLNPAIWERSAISSRRSSVVSLRSSVDEETKAHPKRRSAFRPQFTRYEILEIVAPYLDSKVVVCNLGFPAKELYHVKPQPSNFYMLGSMGMATPIGLGISLSTDRQVVVIDGDGSLLMNPGSLATAACFAPENLTILAIDNGTYGSTGDQPTLASSCVDLEVAARGFGLKNTVKVSAKKELIAVMKETGRGTKFIHALGIPGNKDVPNIPVGHIEIRKQVQNFLAIR